MKKITNFVFLSTIILSCSLVLITSCSLSSANASGEEVAKKSVLEKQEVTVSVYKAKETVFSKELVGNGTLTARKKATVTFQVNDLIKSVKVKEGEKVKQGALVASIDPFTYEKKLIDAQNNYDKALIDLEDLLLGYGFALKDTANVSVNVLKMCKIRSGYNTALSALEEAKRNLSHTKIKAPITGVISNLEAKENNHSSQYDYCCQILDNRSMEVAFHVLEGELGMVGIGQKVEVLPFALPEVSKTGVINSVNPSVENGLIKVTAEIPNANGVLMDGMNVKILVKKAIPGCMVIPKAAVLYRQNRKVVFVHKNGVAWWVYVKTGMENSTKICVTDESIKPGDEVIISNNLNLAHETPVTIATSN